MANGYVRQSASAIIALAKLTSAAHNNEYNALQTAFDSAAGHNHNPAVTGAGSQIDLTLSVAGILPIANGGLGATLILPLANGGTAAATAAAARTNLGISTIGNTGAITDATGTLLPAHGGTGVVTIPAHGVVLGNGTSAVNTASGSSAGQVLTWNASGDPSFASASAFPVTERSTNTLLAAADGGKFFKITSGTFTQTFDTAANLGASWIVLIENTGTGIITVTTDGATWKLYTGEWRAFYSDGANLKSICLRAASLADTTSGSITIAPGWTGLEYEILGGGGGGGGGFKQATGSGLWTIGGTGGGGGSYKRGRIILADTSLTAGGTIAYTIGASGTVGTGGTSPTAGGVGGDTTFNGETGWGGGGGKAGSNSGTTLAGGGGAGGLSAANGSTGGSPAVSNTTGVGCQGVTALGSGISAEFGGGTGGGCNGGVTNGGSSLRGGAGGGIGASFNASDATVNSHSGSPGGAQGTMTTGQGASGGGANTNGTAGSYGANGLGQGGGGGGDALTNTIAGNGGAGSPGCGGGGGGANLGTGTAGNGGLGGTGKIIIKAF